MQTYRLGFLLRHRTRPRRASNSVPISVEFAQPVTVTLDGITEAFALLEQFGNPE